MFQLLLVVKERCISLIFILLSRSIAEKMNLVKSNVQEVQGGNIELIKGELVQIQQSSCPISLQHSLKDSNTIDPQGKKGIAVYGGIMEKVTKPTDSCSPIAVVLKGSGSVWIFIILIRKFSVKDMYCPH